MVIRQIGRRIYHSLTSSKKRPFIKLTLEQLEGHIADAARAKDSSLLFGIFLELSYRLTSPARRDKAKQNIAALLKEFEDINIAPNAARSEIEDSLTRYLEEAYLAHERPFIKLTLDQLEDYGNCCTDEILVCYSVYFSSLAIEQILLPEARQSKYCCLA